MVQTTPGGVVVAVDSSAEAREALYWAAADAQRRHAVLHVVHALPVPWGRPKDSPQVVAESERLGEWVSGHAVRRVERSNPGVVVTSEVLVGHAGAQIIEASREAALLVLGARGHGALTGRLIGSVSQQVTSHASVPVAVVRGPRPDPDAPVVVGIDDSDAAMAALGFALREGRRRGVGVRAVHAAYIELMSGAMAPTAWPAYYDEVLDERSAAVLARARSEGMRYPDVPLEVGQVRAHPVTALDQACADAAMVVVGRRGAGGFHGLRLGSVSQAVLARVRCTVLVVPEGGAGRR